MASIKHEKYNGFFFFSPVHLNLDPQCNPRLEMILVVEVKVSIFKKVLTIVTRSNINKLNFLQNSTNFKRNYTFYGVHLGSIEMCFSKNQKIQSSIEMNTLIALSSDYVMYYSLFTADRHAFITFNKGS